MESDASRVSRKKERIGGWVCACPTEIERYVAMKGSIAIDGISLTVASFADGIAEAAIIPFTYANTNLRALVTGDAVNLEVDILAKYVERLLGGAGAPPSRRV